MRIKNNTTHGATVGGTTTPEFRTWCHIRSRCLNPNNKFYSDYGGRGITVCQRWLDAFENFLADMGPRPSVKHSIDRIDNDGNYEPGNCRWATISEQARNTRQNRNIEFNGSTVCVTDLARMHGIDPRTLTRRLDSGRSVEEALGMQKHSRKRTQMS